MTQFDSATDGTVDYTYDDTNQLTGADYDYQTDESYSYDANGNRTRRSYTTGDDNRLTSDGTYTLRLRRRRQPHRPVRRRDDTAARSTPATPTSPEYTWDYRNRLTNVTECATYGGSATKAVDFAYDHENRLVSESVDPDGAGEETAEDDTFFAYDGSQIALQFNGTESADLSHRYLWGPAVDQILADEEGHLPRNRRRRPLAPHRQPRHRPRPGHLRLRTDTTTVANHRTYDAYGRRHERNQLRHRPPLRLHRPPCSTKPPRSKTTSTAGTIPVSAVGSAKIRLGSTGVIRVLTATQATHQQDSPIREGSR